MYVHKFPFGATLRLINSSEFLFWDNKEVCMCVHLCIFMQCMVYISIWNPTWRRLHCHFIICLQNGSVRLKCMWRNITEESIVLLHGIKSSSSNCEAKGYGFSTSSLKNKNKNYWVPVIWTLRFLSKRRIGLFERVEARHLYALVACKPHNNAWSFKYWGIL